MATPEADYYMVQVNLGSCDHPIIPLYRDDEGGDEMYVSDPTFDACEKADDVHAGYIEKPGRVVSFTKSLEEAENIQTGIHMARTLLRGWIDT